jgi:hypothetical protein
MRGFVAGFCCNGGMDNRKVKFNAAHMAEKLTAARKQKGWSVKAIADLLNERLKSAGESPVSYETVRRWFADGITTVHSDVKAAFNSLAHLLELSGPDLGADRLPTQFQLFRSEEVVTPKLLHLISVVRELDDTTFEEVLRIAIEKRGEKLTHQSNVGLVSGVLQVKGYWRPDEPVAMADQWNAWMADQVRGKRESITWSQAEEIAKDFVKVFGPPPDRTPPLELPAFENTEPASDDNQLASKIRERLRQRVLAGDKKLNGLLKGFTLQQAGVRTLVRLKMKQGIEENKAIDLVLDEKART